MNLKDWVGAVIVIAGAVAREVSVVLCVDVVHLPLLKMYPRRRWIVRIQDLLHVADRGQQEVEDVTLWGNEGGLYVRVANTNIMRNFKVASLKGI